MADECRAAVLTALNKPLEILNVPIPELEPGALLVKIVASTLCGTDVHRCHELLSPSDRLPFITGHEPCGTVEQINGKRTDIFGDPVKPGERIVWSYPSCGSCYYCTVAVQPCICTHRASWGHNCVEQYPYLLGSVSEYMYVPAQCTIVKVPQEVSSASAAAAACAYRTVMHGFDRIGTVAPNEMVTILGAGPLGAFATAVAKDRGAKQVLTIGAPANRLAVAKKMGADAICNLDDVTDLKERVAWVKEHTGGRGADVVIQVANNAATPEGLSMLRRGGRFCHIGTGGKATLPVERLPEQLTFYTVRSGEPRHWLQAIDFLASRRSQFPFEEMISASYTLEQVNEAMEAMASYKVVKPVITFNS